MFTHLTPPRLFILILLASAAALGSALVAQYAFGLKPCELCLFQRVPFVVLIILGGIGLTMNKIKPRQLLVLLCSLVFLINAGIASYHAGVEKKIFSGPSACVTQPSDHPLSIEELKAQIMGAPMVACNEPAWQWRGITMAGINAVFCLLMALFVLAYYTRYRKATV